MDRDILEFELIVTLKSEIFRVNLNFLDMADLNMIEELAIELGINNYLTYYDLESIYNSEYDKVKYIYKQWSKDILIAYENIVKKLNGRLN